MAGYKLNVRLWNALLSEAGSAGDEHGTALAAYAASRTNSQLLRLTGVGRKGIDEIRAWHTAMGHRGPASHDLEKAAALLRAHGYTVLPPNVRVQPAAPAKEN